MTQLRFFLAPLFVFFDLKIYREVREIKTGKAVAFLAYISLLFTLALFIFGATQIGKVHEMLGWVKANLPAMTLTNKGMTLDAPGRHEMRHPQFGLLAVFDDKVESVPLDQAGEAMLYMTSKMVYIKKNGTIQASQIGSRAKGEFKTRIDADFIDTVYKKVKVPLAALAFAGFFLYGFITRLISAVFFALGGLAFQMLMPRGLDFTKLFRISSFVLAIAVPFMFLQYIPSMARFFSGAAGLVLAIVYLGLAVSVQPKPASAQNS